ncbi:hypothetical protein IPA_05800 [Ignicoccus pacificus DSM 13166]|uniref:Uncharacterized protein n=1 Tax=Ignicoccus pacificus DSM 13166 TaxID=940294 RepID=A0A977KBE7_9CREN|nr:hypothetical protein IPA_05800 [Ignicoccus pacificus DSM 13166]
MSGSVDESIPSSFNTPLVASSCEDCIYFSQIAGKCLLESLSKGKVRSCSEAAWVMCKTPECNEIELCLESSEDVHELLDYLKNSGGITDRRDAIRRKLNEMGYKLVDRKVNNDSCKALFLGRCSYKTVIYCDEEECFIGIID